MSEAIKILCVDDEENVLSALKRLFLDYDYEIITATSGSEGLEILNNTDTVQIVISDYRMPQMNGVDFLQKVYRNWPDTVRIVLSGFADMSVIVDAINEGHTYEFIQKPWDDDKLKTAISNALDHYYKQQRMIDTEKELIKKHPELCVDEETADTNAENTAVTSTDNVFDTLPDSIIGIDHKGTIIQCNRKGQEIISPDKHTIIGTNRLDSLPEEINAFIEDVSVQGDLIRSVSRNGSTINVKGVQMKYSDEQEGFLLIFEDGISHD
jgi:two-component system NtrC family sensor kinase